jgi:ribosomal protein S18 acetylase RimI-like enzyme
VAEIRGYRVDDLDALYVVSLATGHAGGDAAALYRDPRLIGHIYVGPYAALLPGLVLVAEDAEGVAGYILGALDTRGFEDRQEAEWWPALRAVYPDPAGTPADRRNADQQRCHRIHHPLRMPEDLLRRYPSHLHINLLPRLQGRGVGRRLIEQWLRMAVAGRSSGVHLAVNAANGRAVGFYRALGFGEVPVSVTGAPHAVWLARHLP